MTHNEKRQHWLKEGAIGLGTGVLYGVTSVAVGHPFDTIKTKMQAQEGFIKGPGMGALPPLLGSGVYRSTQFAVFEALYTKWDNEVGREEIPHTQGVQVRVVGAAVAAATARSLLECPIEFAKVARQTGQDWKLGQVYRGFGLQLGRTGGVMTTYFVTVDAIRRHHPSVFQTKIGQFLASAGAATFGFWVVWPLEVLKNQVQAGTPVGPRGREATLVDRVLALGRGGLAGLYRGILPGTLRSVVSNGFSMVVMIEAQKWVTQLGLR
ncbi:hypothetical protein NSK_002050 [Nannochloropsis salina CCMP1776]|uniref:Mitochondrial carrier protein n=1 Tax=Nannochloropsis salina CCMP1776 TaxID=1027361 RepID=A0A4D9DA97_9STRA|nr:hypothetical protein NSK_002050 [Nannochloropsis salina CCMP1776]|eukprot:TFJ86963.1 hypothetical protein NSK_002050 [Nannochloropsis salina CCMP1776]